VSELSTTSLDALVADLGDIPIVTDPKIVRRRSRDFFWYSPILNQQLDGKSADLIEVLNLDEKGKTTREPVNDPLLTSVRHKIRDAGEALRTLETEGLLRHVPNQGYFVVSLSSSEMRQVYLMRRLLETELYRTLRKAGRDELRSIRSIHSEIKEAVAKNDIGAVLEANRRFHFAIFALSPLVLVTRQVERLWHQSEPFRAAYLWLPEAQRRITAEHAAMLRSLESYEMNDLIGIADRHRSAAEASVVRLLASQESGEEVR
jgi:DNA-binding GntR family transcriptional regulator